MTQPRVVSLQVGDDPQAWRNAGFALGPPIDDARCWIPGADPVCLELLGSAGERGLRGWTIDPGHAVAPAGTIDGIATTFGVGARMPVETPPHPNGVIGIDHVVVLSPALPRTVAALGVLGLEPRRQREATLGGAPIRQIFYRTGGLILEVIGTPDVENEGPASLWGITFVVSDLDATVAYFGENTSPAKDAVQPGRRISTLRHRALDLSVRTAFITPHRSH